MSRAKKYVIGALAIIAVINGVANQLSTAREVMSQQDLAFGLIGVALIFIWYRLDAEEREFRRSAVLNTMVVAVAFIALPYYLFRTRGLSKGAIATGLLVVAVLMYTALQYGGAYAAYYLSRSGFK
jgi:amino acid transporter